MGVQGFDKVFVGFQGVFNFYLRFSRQYEVLSGIIKGNGAF